MTIGIGSPVAVVGAGAIGCYFGGMLARAGANVTLIGRRAHVDAIKRDGLLLQSREFALQARLERTLPVPCPLRRLAQCADELRVGATELG